MKKHNEPTPENFFILMIFGHSTIKGRGFETEEKAMTEANRMNDLSALNRFGCKYIVLNKDEC